MSRILLSLVTQANTPLDVSAKTEFSVASRLRFRGARPAAPLPHSPDSPRGPRKLHRPHSCRSKVPLGAVIHRPPSGGLEPPGVNAAEVVAGGDRFLPKVVEPGLLSVVIERQRHHRRPGTRGPSASTKPGPGVDLSHGATIDYRCVVFNDPNCRLQRVRLYLTERICYLSTFCSYRP